MILLAAFAACSAAAACGAGTVPPSVAAIERAPVARTTPESAASDWLLAFVDVETTGVRLDVEDEPHVAALHTGITGAMLNIRIYQALLNASAARP